MKRFGLSTFALLAALSPLEAQWGTPQHSIPVGRGPGFTGFTSVGPCLTGVPIIGAGVAASPACHSVAMSTYAPLASPTFTGNPLAPTPVTADNDTSIATTAFVQSNLASYLNMVSGGATYMTRAAAIAASTPATVPSVYLLGYAVAGDAGYGAYYTSMVCPAVTAPDFQDAGGRCWTLTTRQPVLGFFGADRTGVADSTAAINSFHTYTFLRELCGNYQAGTYKFAGPVTISGTINPGQALCFDGAGRGLTYFNNTNLASNDFVIDTSVAGINGGHLANFGFSHASVKTAGTGIIQTGSQPLAGGFRLQNIDFINTFSAIAYVTANTFSMDNIIVHSVGPEGRGISLDGTILTGDINYYQFLNGLSGAAGTNTTAIYIGNGVAAINFNKCHIQSGAPNPANRGIWIAGGAITNYITFDGCYVDTFTNNALLVQDGTRIEFRNGNIMYTSSGNHGANITGGKWIWLHHNLFYGNQGHGISVTSGAKDVKINDNTFAANSDGSAAVSDDINIGANTTNFKVNDNNFCSAEPVWTRYNVNVVAGTSNYYDVMNNMTGSTGTASPHCHRTAGVFDGGTGTIKNVSGNAGAAWQTWTSTISCSAGTPTTITVNAARYEIAGPRVTINIQMTLTNIGTCTGTLNFTLPTTSQATTAVFNAINMSTLTAKNAVTTAGAASGAVFADGLAFPGVNGNIINVTGVYETTAP